MIIILRLYQQHIYHNKDNLLRRPEMDLVECMVVTKDMQLMQEDFKVDIWMIMEIIMVKNMKNMKK